MYYNMNCVTSFIIIIRISQIIYQYVFTYQLCKTKYAMIMECA